MENDSIRERLESAHSLEEVRELTKDRPEGQAERIWEELERHRSNKSERLDLDELDAVSGGSHRDWKREGCAATCEPSSWCWSNDQCLTFEVVYSNFWVTCPDGYAHVFKNHVCVRCGYEEAHLPDDGGYR